MIADRASRAAVTAYLGLGSNLGERGAHLRAAVAAMRAWPEVIGLEVSLLYETEYVGPGEQAPYLNACVRLLTTLGPQRLHRRLRELEMREGRLPETHMQPRTLDVDLLLYGDLRVRTPHLEIPHPRMRRRRFVLEPLLELDPDLWLPGDDGPLRRELDDPDVRGQEVRVVAGAGWWRRGDEGDPDPVAAPPARSRRGVA